jgi:capsular exopolysaccharide synthesis family protein
MAATETLSKASGLDFKRVLKKYFKNWWMFAIGITIAVLYAQNENKYIEPQYSMSTSLLIEDKSNKSVLEAKGAIMSSPLYLSSKLIENQIAFLKSFAQIKRIISQLNFDVSYFSKGKYIWSTIYTDSPFFIEYDDEHNQVRYQKFIVRFHPGNRVSVSSPTYAPFLLPRTFDIGEQIESNDYSFRVVLKPDINLKQIINKEYGFKIKDINGLTNEYKNRTDVYLQRNTSILIISTTGSNKQQEKDYLNKLTEVFLQSNLEKKNIILTNTIDFINGQLVSIGDMLNESEESLEEFRKGHQFMQLSNKAAALLSRMSSETKSKRNLMLDLKYYQYLKDYLLTHNKFEDIVQPSTVGASLPLFSDLVLKLSTVSLKKENMIANSSMENPYILSLEEEIRNMKDALIENISSIIVTTEIKLNDMDGRIKITDAEFAQLPGIERAYLEIQRKYKIFNSLYDFLLRRKSEVEIQRAANLPDHEIIDYAGDSGISKISKSPKSTYINALVWAILGPSVFLFLLVFLNDRVMSIDDIYTKSYIPFLGDVSSSNSMVLDIPNSHFSEKIRLIRIKLGLDSKEGKQVALVTSATFDEGKSFFAANFASVYALAGRRTILLGFDLRLPNLAKLFGANPSIGITDYLINPIRLDEVIQKTRTKNLDLLLSGPIPPNADELVESTKTTKLFAELRRIYDYIIIDTPPIGLVGDAYILSKFSDANVFVIRNNFSKKKVVTHNINEAINNKMDNLNIVLNDVKLQGSDANKIFYVETIKKRNIFSKIVVTVRRKIIDLLRKI